MDKNPKRRRKNDNPYHLSKDEIQNIYVVSFEDSLGIFKRVKVSKEIYMFFNEAELDDLSELNEFDRHIEHSEIYENSLEKRANEKTISMEDEFIQKTTFEELKKAIEMLPEIQKRRIKKYYFEDKNEYQIAEEEGSTQQSVHIILQRGLKNLQKILKNFK